VNVDQVLGAKVDESCVAKIPTKLKTPEVVGPVSHCIQAKRVAKRTFSVNNHQVMTDIEIKREVEESNVIEIVDFCGIDVDPKNMSVYSDVVSYTRKYASLNQLKKCI
jgi:hypothetical protein